MRPTRQRRSTDHFGDVLPSQCLGLVLKKTKLNAAKANNTGTKRQNTQKAKPKSKENLNQQSALRTAGMCVRIAHCVQLSYTIQRRTSLIIFPLVIRRTIIAQMLFARGEGSAGVRSTVTMPTAERHRSLAGVELYRLLTYVCVCVRVRVNWSPGVESSRIMPGSEPSPGSGTP